MKNFTQIFFFITTINTHLIDDKLIEKAEDQLKINDMSF